MQRCPVCVARAPARVDDARLAVVAPGVGREQGVERLARARAVAQLREPVGAVARVGERLGRDRADLGLEPGHDGADGQELRRHRDAQLPRMDVAGDDRERHAKARTTSPGCPSCTVAPTPMRASSSRSAAGVPVSSPNVP